MGIQDRDYYYEQRDHVKIPKERKPAPGNSAQWPWKTLIRDILVWVGLALVLLLTFHHYQSSKQTHTQAANPFAAVVPAFNCGTLPSHGSAYLIDPAEMKRTDVLYSGLKIHNNYEYPMVAMLSDSTGARQLLALSIHAGNTVQLSIPVGQYGMQVLVGSTWCNLNTGFTDGTAVTVAGGISINTGSTTSMQFDGSGLRPVRLALAYSLLQPASQQNSEQSSEMIGFGKLELKQTQNGHYFSSGTVNGIPVVFMVDTGATTVSVSSEIAAQAGIRKCAPRQVSTANGLVGACTATVPEVTFGPFQFTHIDVMIMPNMPGEALLGMNVLRNFRIEQVDKVLRISTP